MRILLTGSAGFVGTRLTRALRRAGHEVLGIDLRAPASDRGALCADLLDVAPGSLPPFDVCFHLASQVGGFLHNSERHELVDVESALVAQALRLCRSAGCRRLIYTSSIAVFEASGTFAAGPLTTRDQRTPYACAKAAAEALIEEALDEFAIVRPTNIFGPQQRRAGQRAGESHVIPDLLHKLAASDGQTLEVLGDGRQQRNFIHVDDVVSFLMTVMRHPARGWFNLRSEIQLSIGELAAELLRLTERNHRISYRPEFLQYEPHPITRFDLAPAQALGWRPRITTLADGLRGPVPARRSPADSRPSTQPAA